MRTITRRLRLLAAVLGIAQGVAPASAIAHELAGYGSGAPVAHAESQEATHEVVAHAHDCGLCRNILAKVLPSVALRTTPVGPASQFAGFDDRFSRPRPDDRTVPLPRGPPVG